MTHVRRRKSGARLTFWSNLLMWVVVLGIVPALAVQALNQTPMQTVEDHSYQTVVDTSAHVSAATTPQPTASVQDQSALETAEKLSEAFRQAAARVLPAVVSIETRAAVPVNAYSGEYAETSGIGSGVIIDPSGIILTNNHVVMGGDADVTVKLSDGRKFRASDIRTDPKTDIAVIRLHGADGLPTARLGDSDRVRIGDWVLALGQPFGLESSVTAGIISAKERGIGLTDRENFLQTDAAINPGNSGGPLINLRGEVIGINTAIRSSSGGNNGVAFSVPISLARWVSDQLLQYGVVHRAFLGVQTQPLNFELAKMLKAPTTDGVVVTHVSPNTPAWQAGLKPGDVIVEINDVPIRTLNQFLLALERIEPGKNQELTVLRRGKTVQLQFIPTQRPVERQTTYRPVYRETVSNELGLQIAPIHGEMGRRLGVPQDEVGALVVGVKAGSIADRADLKPGMIIQQVDGRDVRSVDDVVRMFQAGDLKDGILLLVKTPTGSQFVVLKSEQDR